ncbi:MAG TPA: methionyl-tRNA formyltransferase [Patescibacteria group bacterium]
MNKNTKIVFFGTPKIGAVALEALVKESFEIPLVVTRASKPIGRKKIVTPTPVKQVAQKYKIPISIPAKLKDNPELILKLKDIDPDLIVVAAYGKIIPNEILNLPKCGVINVHPSLLPKYRGAAPIHFPILRGEEKTGVTIIKMSEGLDEGDIISQSQIPIEKNDTAESMIDKLSELASRLLVATIPPYVKWQTNKKSSNNFQLSTLNFQLFLPPKPQDHTKATYTAMLSKESGRIDPKNPPNPKTFDLMIRAYYPWPGVWTELEIKSQRNKESKKMRIKFLPNGLRAQEPNNPIMIQPEGKKQMKVTEFLNGYPQFKQLMEQLGLA